MPSVHESSAISSIPSLIVTDLGLIEYQKAYQYQMLSVSRVMAGGLSEIIFCEHPPVLTLGRLANRQFILADENQLAQLKIDVVSVDRGGEVTLHAPGQLIVYPILNLTKYGKDLHQFMRTLEDVGIEFLARLGIESGRHAKNTGVWVKDKKIISIGVGVKRWVSFHGMGININTDLKLFSLIKPCGLSTDMTSAAEIKKEWVSLDFVKEVLREIFMHKFTSPQI